MNEYLNFTFKIARNAGKLLMDYYNSNEDLNIHYKKDSSIVSLADIESEKLIRNAIKEKFPEHSILGEEKGFTEGKSEYIWYIDPLDGTTNYSIHYPFFCISIALCKKTDPLLSVVYFPPQNELFYAVKNKGAFLNNKKLKVSPERSLKNAIIAFSNSRDEGQIRQIAKIFLKFKLLKQKLRHFGSAALEMCYVASGRISAFFSLGTNIWDVAAGMLLVKEAGGIITNLKGDNILLDRNINNIIASNGLIHKNLLNLLNSITSKY